MRLMRGASGLLNVACIVTLLGCAADSDLSSGPHQPYSADQAFDAAKQAAAHVQRAAFFHGVSPHYLAMSHDAGHLARRAVPVDPSWAQTLLTNLTPVLLREPAGGVTVIAKPTVPVPPEVPPMQVGTVCLFLNTKKVLALSVVRERGEEAAASWYLVFEGEMGDAKFFRLGSVARRILDAIRREP